LITRIIFGGEYRWVQPSVTKRIHCELTFRRSCCSAEHDDWHTRVTAEQLNVAKHARGAVSFGERSPKFREISRYHTRRPIPTFDSRSWGWCLNAGLSGYKPSDSKVWYTNMSQSVKANG
jgi:hypothetical protein